MWKMDQKLKKYLNEGGNGNITTTDIDSDAGKTPKRRIAEGAAVDVASPLTYDVANRSLFAKMADVLTKLSTKIDNFEMKCMAQFDNLTSRLNSIEKDLGNIDKVVHALNGTVRVAEGMLGEKILSKMPNWNTVEEIQELNEEINVDKSIFKSKLVKEMANIGGSTAQTTISNILKRCLPPPEIKKFTLKGSKEKSCFSITGVYKCVVGK